MTPPDDRLSRACVVIPTFNESQNIARLCRTLRRLSAKMVLLVVDDNSPDGTGALAGQVAGECAPMEVVHRAGKGGRGSACLEGFRRALGMPGVDYIVEMDADFSHDPAELPQTLQALSSADMVIRSRYLPDSVIVDWPLSRRIFSSLANRFARWILRISLSDFTNGYRAYTREAVEALEFDRIDAKGFIVLSEVADQLHSKGFQIQELPSVFVNRRRGQSNVTPNEIWGAFLGILRLWRKQNTR